MRVEHVQPSRCREDFLARRTANDIKKAAAKKAGGANPKHTACLRHAPRTAADPLRCAPCRAEKADVKRQPVGPRPGLVLENVKMTVRCALRRVLAPLPRCGTLTPRVLQTVTPIPYDIVREGIKY